LSPDPLLLAAIRAVARSGDPDATLDELLEIGLRAAGGDRAAAFLWDSEAGGLALAGARGYPPDDLPTLEAAVGATDHPIKLAAEERIQTIGQPDANGRVLVAWPIVVGRDGIEEPGSAWRPCRTSSQWSSTARDLRRMPPSASTGPSASPTATG
jgi:hypothetical protein